MLTTYYTIIILALIIMVGNLFIVAKLYQIAPGGTIGKVIRTLIVFITVFTTGYFFAPSMPKLPMGVNLIVVSIIYLFGAVFVMLVLWLIKSLLVKVLKDLEG